jgi:hypothetical protein
VIFPHIAVRTPILPNRDLNHRSRSAGYELDDQTLSPIDSVALTTMRPPETTQKGQVLDPSWTLELFCRDPRCPYSRLLSAFCVRNENGPGQSSPRWARCARPDRAALISLFFVPAHKTKNFEFSPGQPNRAPMSSRAGPRFMNSFAKHI